MDKVPIYLCCWHVLKAWRLRGTEKIKNVKMRGGILQDLHDVMYMSTDHGETIDDFKEHERVIMREGLMMCGQIISGLITITLVSDNIYHGLIFKILL
jgi:hypothetical protein